MSDLERKDIGNDMKVQDMIRMKEDIRKARAHAIRNEQYSRRCNVKVLGLMESKDEDCKQKVVDEMEKKMPGKVTKEDIAVAHRVRSSRSKLPRPMIVRFESREKQEEVIQDRIKFKGTPITIVEDVGRDIILYINRLKNKPGIKQSWYWKGQIYMKNYHDRVTAVEWGTNI